MLTEISPTIYISIALNPSIVAHSISRPSVAPLLLYAYCSPDHGSAARSHAITLGDSSRSLPRLAGQRHFGRGRKCTPCRFSIARTCSTRAPLPCQLLPYGAIRCTCARDSCMQTQCNLPSPNQLQADKDFHSKTTVVCTFAYPTAKFHSRTHPVIRPFNWFEELNVLFSTSGAMTLPLNWAFSCYRTQHPTGV